MDVRFEDMTSEEMEDYAKDIGSDISKAIDFAIMSKFPKAVPSELPVKIMETLSFFCLKRLIQITRSCGVTNKQNLKMIRHIVEQAMGEKGENMFVAVEVEKDSE